MKPENTYVLCRKSDGLCILKTLHSATGFWGRGMGLLGKSTLPISTGLLIETSSIHTFFMRFSLDLLYLDSDTRVVKIVRDIRPWSMSCAWGAQSVVECLAGELSDEVCLGDELLMRDS